MFVGAGVPEAIEHAAIASLVNTYGKTWHTWQIDKHSALPIGIPQLMMGFTADGQLRPEMVQSRDAAFGISTVDVKRARADLAASATPADSAADAWRSGQSRQLALTETPLKNLR